MREARRVRNGGEAGSDADFGVLFMAPEFGCVRGWDAIACSPLICLEHDQNAIHGT